MAAVNLLQTGHFGMAFFASKSKRKGWYVFYVLRMKGLIDEKYLLSDFSDK